MGNQAILVYDVEGMPEAGGDVAFDESDFTEKKKTQREYRKTTYTCFIKWKHVLHIVWKDFQIYYINSIYNVYVYIYIYKSIQIYASTHTYTKNSRSLNQEIDLNNSSSPWNAGFHCLGPKQSRTLSM